MDTRRFYMGICRSLLFTVFLFLFVLFPGQKAAAEDFTIEQYHVDMKVSQRNVYYIQETIKVNFYAARHGIYRDIPMQNYVGRSDGSTSVVRASIRNISCGSDDFQISRQNGNCRIKLGNKDEMVFGEKVYNISYEYCMGKDVLQGADEFYYNVIGTGWSTTIRNVTFSILMPEAFDENRLGITYGYVGNIKKKGLRYSVIGNRIDGMLDNYMVLQSGEGITVRLELPEGYFVPDRDIPWEPLGAILLGIFTIVGSYIVWSNYGKDDPVVETIGFYAPAGLNSVEAAYAYKGYLQGEDVVSLVVYLAQQGYIEIKEAAVAGGSLGSSFSLVKLKEYTGTNVSERMFMNGLFRKGKYVTKSDLENTFYKTVKEIVSQVSTQFKHKIFYWDSLNKNWILYLMLAFVFLAAGLRPLYEYEYNLVWALLELVPAGLSVTLAFAILFGKGKLLKRISAFFMTVVCVCARIIIPMRWAFMYADPAYGIAFVFAIIVAAVVSFFIKYMPRRTPYGNKLLGELGGFKRFLETAERDRLEAMVAENPQYFYDILPYTYVLDVSDVWMKKFESIAVEPPNWYHGYAGGRFHVAQFHHFMDSTMEAASSSMTSQPKSKGGGGGGFSGGGSGGGGGGSW